MEHADRIAQLESEVAARDAIIETLTEKIRQLERTVAELTERLNRNSRNSHLPPSSDGPGGRGRQDSKNKSKACSRRKPGGQPGHRGHHRGLLPPDRVNHIENHFPPECNDCGAGLPRIEDPNAVRDQTTEIPPVNPEVTEHRYHEVECGSIQETTA